MVIYFIFFAFIGTVCFVLGFLIWKKKKLNLIHDYHLQKVKDFKKYGSAIGRNLLLLGSFLFINGIIGLIDEIPISITAVILLIGMVLIIINFFRIQKKYSTSSVQYYDNNK